MGRTGRQDPTKFRYLTENKVGSYAEEAIELYKKAGKIAQPWEEHLLDAILSYDKNGQWCHSDFGFSVSRRNGKSEIITMVELWALTHGLKVLYTAHRVTTSTSSFERLHSFMEKAGFVEGGRGVHRREEDLGKEPDYKTLKNKGGESVKMTNGGVCYFRTRTVKGGLGEGFDIVIVDEAQEYTDDQNSSLNPTLTDSPNPLRIMTGTPPTPVSTGTVFTKYRNDVLMTKPALKGWAEWSVDEMTDVHNIDAWYLTNPGLGYHLSERNITREISGDDVDFNIQRLGLWLEYNLHSVISETDWDALNVNKAPPFSGKLFIGIKFGKGTPNVAMSIAVKTKDDQIYVETIDMRSIREGNKWIIDFLRSADWDKVVVDGASGQKLLGDDMKSARLKKPIFPTTQEIIVANACFENGLFSKILCHHGQTALRYAATNCDKRPIGANGGFGYRSIRDDSDIAMLDSVILAFWACFTSKPKKKKSQIIV